MFFWKKTQKEDAESRNNGAPTTGVKDNKTIELIAILMFFSITLISEVSRTIGLEKECRKTSYGTYVRPFPWSTVCDGIRDHISIFPFYDRFIHGNHAEHLIWRTAVQSIMGVLVLAFLGDWSDKTGKRKVILYLPITGIGFLIIHCIFNVIILDDLPVEYFVFFNAFFNSLISVGVVFFGFFTYVFEFSTAEERLFRYGMIAMSAFIGMTIGYAFSWILLRYIGYISVFVVVSIISAINCWLVAKKLEDPLKTIEQIQYDTRSCMDSVKSVFGCSSIRETITIVRKKTDGNRSVKLYISLATMFLLFVSVFGERSIYNWYFRSRLIWNQYQFNIFYAVKSVTAIVGVWIAVVLISRRFQYHDAVIGVLSSVSKIIASIFFCFALTDIAIYFGVLFDMFNGTALLATVSMYSKLLDRNEIGKVNSLVGIIENLARLVYVPIYWVVGYGSMPVQTYFTGFSFTLPALCIYLWILHQNKIKVGRQDMISINSVDV